MKFPIPREYKHIRPVDQVWYGEPHYKSSLIVPEISMKYGSLVSKVKTMPSYAKYLIGSLRELSKSVKSIERNPYLGKSHISEADLAAITERAKGYGILRWKAFIYQKNNNATGLPARFVWPDLFFYCTQARQSNILRDE